jgi:hypothetical protein
VSARAQIELEALGDFDASNRTAESASARGGDRELRFPLSTRAVTAQANDGDDRWLGAASVYGDSAVFALLPEDADCVFHRAEPGSYPAKLDGQAWGLSADGRFLLLAGGTDADAAGTLILELGTGAVGALANGLGSQRAFATVTPLGSGFLVAGGESPDGIVWSTGDIVEASITPGPAVQIAVGQVRAHHGATVLPSGETLLVAGYGENRAVVLSTLVAIPPTPPYQPRLGRLAVLATGRIDPTVITLSDGRILVGGGQNALGEPITSVEWLTPDAARSARAPLELADFGAAGVRLAFTALPGGAVLVAGNDGKDALGVRTPQAYWISADGSVEVIPLPKLTPTRLSHRCPRRC